MKALFHLWMGLKHGYPLCCVITFVFGRAKGIRIRRDLYDSYRPCWLHRHFDKCFTDFEYNRLLNEGVDPLPRSDYDKDGFYRRDLP